MSVYTVSYECPACDHTWTVQFPLNPDSCPMCGDDQIMPTAWKEVEEDKKLEG